MVKLWYYGKNYGTMEKTMVLYRKLWNFDLLWKNYGTMEKTMVLWTKLWYYGKNYGTISKTMELRFTKERNMVDNQKITNFDL